MKTKIVLHLLFLFLTGVTYAEEIKKVGGTYPFYVDAGMSIRDAKIAAIENARIQAIAKEFGTIVAQQTDTRDQVVNGRENNLFLQISSSEVKGEWLEDIIEPLCEVVEVTSDVIVLRATVSGKARAISNEAIDFDTKVLRNGTELRFADTRFKSGDDMMLYFKAPVDGYVAVYLVDEQPTAFCLLPYMGDNDGQQPVRKNRDYIFFSPAKASKEEQQEVDEMVFTCANEYGEHNQLYVIFSPLPFTKAMDEQVNEALPRQLSYKDFQHWLSRNRKHDSKMGVKVIHLEINI